MNGAGLFFVAIGLFPIAGAYFNWDWFMNDRKARVFVAFLGRTGARIFYALLGIGLVVFGILITLGIIHLD